MAKRRKKGFDAKKVAMGIGLAVVVALFAGFGADYIASSVRDGCSDGNGTCYSVPKTPSGGMAASDDDCASILTAEECTAEVDCYWQDDRYSDECRQTYQNVFTIFASVVGALGLIISFMVKNNNALSGGLMGGGIGALIIATISYWSRMSDLIRVLLILVLLIILVWIAYKKLKD